MIQLKKTSSPQILIDKAKTWTEELLGFHQKLETPPTTLLNKYNHPDVKKQLSDETNQKCLYCESFIFHAQHGDIEHIKPKSKFPELTYDWENLSISCRKCNSLKSDYFDESAPLLNPYQSDPSNHLYSVGPLILSKDNDLAGKSTEQRIDLNRADLVLRRSEKIRLLKSLIERFRTETNSSLKMLLKNELLREASSDKEFSFVLSTYLKHESVS
jgi:5-methylcytosine-specific restriction endonuclease McrA